MKRVLIVCDSVGADWPRYRIYGYANLLAKELEGSASVEVRTYGGIPITGIIDDLKILRDQRFDVALLHVGNPDIHPRLPHRPLKALRSLGLRFCRERIFAIPPRLGIEWLLRAPLFLTRLAIIRVRRDFYSTVDETVKNHIALTEMLRSVASRVVVIPLFEVSSRVYGPAHNHRANEINARLATEYRDDFLIAAVVTSEVYSRFYEADAFHFKRPYHKLLVDHLCKVIQAA